MSSASTQLNLPSAWTHVRELDGVRGLAILPVLLAHFMDDTGFEPQTLVDRAYFGVVSLGWWGVDLFFVLSGFLITGILLDARGTPHALRNFYARRTLRIFPLYYLYLAIMLMAVPRIASLFARTAPPGDGALWLWLYLTNVRQALENSLEAVPAFTGHFWSLAVEEQFYLIWPWLVYAMDRSRLAKLCVVLIIASPILRVAFGFADQWIAGYTLMPARMDSLAIGALLAIKLRDGFDFRAHLRNARYVAAIAFGAFVATTFAPDVHGPVKPLLQAFDHTALAVIFGSLLMFATSAASTSLARRALRSTPLVTLGKYSYALYVLHVPISYVLAQPFFPIQEFFTVGRSRLPMQLLFVPLAMFASLIAAYLSWRVIEKPCLSLKRHFRYGRPDEPSRSVRSGAPQA